MFHESTNGVCRRRCMGLPVHSSAGASTTNRTDGITVPGTYIIGLYIPVVAERKSKAGEEGGHVE